ncbi:M48 family metallopeptidase [Photobacterium aphoticum]|uniref:M48 family metallopeptidase n=1 Tax=Photobacterium aphoticum TaxID=754436 RepID=UPI0009E49A15|nr:M48 family metallopeptidase [Photobacterium aphoticum]PSU54503.1 hypothetical protein C9I90_20255 [Photobacterium aphoticum]GHA66281.1 peptidase M48 [Photobacterium aphoticum]
MRSQTVSMHGVYHPPCSAQKQAATLTVLPDDRLQLTFAPEGNASEDRAFLEAQPVETERSIDDRVVQTVPVSSVTIDPPLGRLPMKVIWPDGALFIPNDASACAAALAPALPARFGSCLHRLERHWPMIGVSLMVTLLLCIGFFTHGIPWLSRALVVVIPSPVAQHVGEHVLDTLDDHFLLPSQLSKAQQQAVRAQFEALQTRLGPFPVPPRLLFRASESGPNAFALSDGTVIVLDSLVTLAETPAQLESVLLHELGHVQHEHVMQAMVRSVLLSVSVMVITGESSGVIDTLSGAGVFVMSQGYSREAEEEADAYAASHMRALYGTVAPMKAMFEALHESVATQGDEEEAVPQWLMTHPRLVERIEALGE